MARNKASTDKEPKKAGTEKEPKETKEPKKGSGLTKSWKLSKELAAVVGEDEMPRSQVIKKLWAVIKEKKLQDPDNKQFTICDDQLFKVIGVKRFRTFGMMKYLKNHFVKAV